MKSEPTSDIDAFSIAPAVIDCHGALPFEAVRQQLLSNCAILDLAISPEMRP